MLDMEPLEERRQKIALNFATKILKHPEHRKNFNYRNSDYFYYKTRSGKKVIVPKFRTARYGRSTVPALAKLIGALALEKR